MRGLLVTAFLALTSAAFGAGAEAPAVIQRAALEPTRAYFVPMHPRVTTTLRFPGPIGAPDGAVGVFAEDAAKAGAAEYLVTWQTGDAYLTLTPLRSPKLANLNIPYQGRTYVFYFYGVEDPLRAVASVILDAPVANPAADSALAVGPTPSPATEPEVTRTTAAPARETVAATPARLLGFLDRLKLLHAAKVGAELTAMAAAMHVDVALSAEGGGREQTGNSGNQAIPRGGNDAGLYQIVLLRAVRDARLGCVGFVCLVRNTSDQPVVLDVASFGARAGAEFLSQAIVDAPAELAAGAEMPAYFVVPTPPGTPLRADNDWRISVELISPRLNPGAALARAFAERRSP